MRSLALSLTICDWLPTERRRKSHLNAHLQPRFRPMALMAIDVPTLQRFVTELSSRSASRKGVLNILGTVNAVLRYAKKCGVRVPDIPSNSLTIADDRDGVEAV